MSEPMNWQNRQQWGTLFQEMALQLTSIAGYLTDPNTDNNPQNLQILARTMVAYGANAELAHEVLAAVCAPTYGMTMEELILGGGFRQLNHLINHHNENGECDGTPI